MTSTQKDTQIGSISVSNPKIKANLNLILLICIKIILYIQMEWKF